MSSKKTTPSASTGTGRRAAKRNVPVGSRNFLGYHSSLRPEGKIKRTRKLRLSDAAGGSGGNANLDALTKESRRCIRNLAEYTPPKDAFPQPWLPFPRSRRAAVLVALFVGRKGDLYVLLSKRASTLRTFAGDTSLPGGKMDPEDQSIEDTARREAFEEIGLPPDPRKAPLLCILEPFYVEKQLLVTPIVVLILDITLQPILNSTEVTALFSHPLASFLTSTPPASILRSEPELVELGRAGDDTGYRYHHSNDWEWDGPPVLVDPESELEMKKDRHGVRGRERERKRRESERSSSRSGKPNTTSAGVGDLSAGLTPRRRKIRMHRFLTGREAGGIKPVYGLTAQILIHTARIGFSPSPPTLASTEFELMPPYSPSMPMRIAWAFFRPSTPERRNLFRDALEEEALEGLVNWEKVKRIAGVVEDEEKRRRGVKSRDWGGTRSWIRSKL